ncbi:methyltransferase [Longispora urticae]
MRDEVAERVPAARNLRPVPGRDDSITFDLTGQLKPLLTLRTAVAPFQVLSFPVPGPVGLLRPEHFRLIVDTVRKIVRLNEKPPTSFRIDAAGSDSTVFADLVAQLASATRLSYDAAEGALLLRFRRAVEGQGWEVLIRVSTLPLSARAWRVRDYVAAVNATVAAAMIRLTAPKPTDRYANLMCGSGTLLVERVFAGPVRKITGVDTSAEGLDATRDNLAAAGIKDRVRLVHGDIADEEWTTSGPFDVLTADPPWGDKIGRHEDNEALHTLLLERSHAAAAPGARLVVLTHEIRIMERCLKKAENLWRLEGETRVFQKGHHPRIYLLTKVGPG